VIDRNLAIALVRTGKTGAAKEVLAKLSGEGPQLLSAAILAMEDGAPRVAIKAQAEIPIRGSVEFTWRRLPKHCFSCANTNRQPCC
jgi:hypothetical protein